MPDPTPVVVILVYFGFLLGLGAVSQRYFRGTSADYFVASRSIGPFMLLMSIFGTTMTAFAMVGSTAKAYTTGIGVYGMLASWSGLVHSAVFFLVGIKLWAVGKRYGFLTQCQYFRARFDSSALGYALFPVLILLIIPYLLVGLLGANAVIKGVTLGMFPEVFPETGGAVPPWLTSFLVSAVVLAYVFGGGVRSTAWANTFQTLVFMVAGVAAFVLISRALGGAQAASANTLAHAPQLLARAGQLTHGEFLTYAFIPLSVGMFPHLFQHWLTARSARAFRLTVVFHPICILIVWLPCILIGIWAAGQQIQVPTPNAVLGKMVAELVHSPLLTGLLTAGVLAAIMSSLDSQFMCISTLFTHDLVLPLAGHRRFTDRQVVWIGRAFVVVVVAITYALALQEPPNIFDLGVWCFSGFAALFPLVFAATHWRRVTRAGALAGLIAASLSWVVLFVRADFGHGEGPPLPGGVLPVTLMLAASSLTLVVVSLLTRPPSPATVDRFFPKAPASH
jgi:SSS family solute:Na+ symporter